VPRKATSKVAWSGGKKKTKKTGKVAWTTYSKMSPRERADYLRRHKKEPNPPDSIVALREEVTKRFEAERDLRDARRAIQKYKNLTVKLYIGFEALSALVNIGRRHKEDGDVVVKEQPIEGSRWA
jgi:hypothetical protein